MFEQIEKAVAVSKEEGKEQLEITKEMFDFCNKTLAQIGRGYTPEFLGNLAEEANEVTIDWLKKHSAPQEIIDMHDWSITFYRGVEALGAGKISDIDARELVTGIPDFLESLGNLKK